MVPDSIGLAASRSISLVGTAHQSVMTTRRNEKQMGSLRGLSSEGTKERKADELDRMDAAYGVPPEGLRLMFLDPTTNADLVTFQARRSNFLEQIRKAWRDYTDQPQFTGKPAKLAIQVCAYRDGEEWDVRYTTDRGDQNPRGTDWLIQGEMETQEAANALWEEVVKMWTRIKDQDWLRNL